jgi:hypothetical protein
VRADHGLTWGRTLCGPMMVVDPASRAVVASQADAERRLVAQDGVFVGALPDGENAANTSVTWAGVRWIQLRWPLPADRAQRAVIMMHESFHRLAEQLPIQRATCLSRSARWARSARKARRPGDRDVGSSPMTTPRRRDII